MTDIVKIIKQLILSNPSLKQKLLEQGIITEKDEDIVILKPEAFEIVGSNSCSSRLWASSKISSSPFGVMILRK